MMKQFVNSPGTPEYIKADCLSALRLRSELIGTFQEHRAGRLSEVIRPLMDRATLLEQKNWAANLSAVGDIPVKVILSALPRPQGVRFWTKNPPAYAVVYTKFGVTFDSLEVFLALLRKTMPAEIEKISAMQLKLLSAREVNLYRSTVNEFGDFTTVRVEDLPSLRDAKVLVGLLPENHSYRKNERA